MDSKITTHDNDDLKNLKSLIALDANIHQLKFKVRQFGVEAVDVVESHGLQTFEHDLSKEVH